MGDWSSTHDREREPIYAAREDDWRIGPIVYHVLVDRFAPPADPEAKRHLYAEPRRLVEWNSEPKRGTRIEGSSLWTHEVEFWGGDLVSLRGKLDYIEDLGADVLYLNPIHLAPSNHKYDAMDFAKVSPEYGTREDVASLADEAHQRGMRLMLDGVFNHMGSEAPAFKKALAEPESPEREWFYIGDQYDNGYRGWNNSKICPSCTSSTPMLPVMSTVPAIRSCRAICAKALMAGDWMSPTTWASTSSARSPRPLTKRRRAQQ